MDLSAVPSLLVSPSTVRLFKVRFVLVWLASSPEAATQLMAPYRVLPLPSMVRVLPAAMDMSFVTSCSRVRV